MESENNDVPKNEIENKNKETKIKHPLEESNNHEKKAKNSETIKQNNEIEVKCQSSGSNGNFG